MARSVRAHHPEFEHYQIEILRNPAYAGMPGGGEAPVRWVAAGRSVLGTARLAWWQRKLRDLIAAGRLPSDARISDAARFIHPLGKKPCQICGNWMHLDYVYPQKRLTEKLAVLGSDVGLTPISELVGRARQAGQVDSVRSAFRVPRTVPEANVAQFILGNRRSYLSPGAMANPPDRLDGFHSYNLCCRAAEDKGRHASNMARYGEDRRAYEFWADGDWKAASWAMKRIAEGGMSADHIGPISLGFTHRPRGFQPLSRSANSAKNNRMSAADVAELIAAEARGEEVASWHSKPIWDQLKSHVGNDDDALVVSVLMRQNMHHVLSVLAELVTAGYRELLAQWLHPEYAFYSIEFKNFDSRTATYEEMTKHQGNSVTYARNAARYVRIAFEALEAYVSKPNRRALGLEEEFIAAGVRAVRTVVHRGGDSAEAKAAILSVLDERARRAKAEFRSRRLHRDVKRQHDLLLRVLDSSGR